MEKKVAKNYEFIQKNFPQLIERYGGQYIVIAAGEVFAGKEPKILEKEAHQKYPRQTPIGMPVPKEHDLTCAL